MPVAVVTGGSTGIGAAVVKTLAKRGYDVAFTYLKSEREAEAVAKEAESHGVRILYRRADATSWEEMRAFADEVRRVFGKTRWWPMPAAYPSGGLLMSPT